MTTTDYRKLGLTDDDPKRAEFDMYAKEPPAGEWGYMVDDYGIKYRRGLVAQRLRPGWWPFAYEDAERERQARRPRHGDNVPQECGAAIVRLTPDTAFYSWRNEMVIADPDLKVPHLAQARLTLWVRPQGMGGIVIDCDVTFDLKARTYSFADNGERWFAGIGADWPAELKEQAESKAAKLLAFFLAAMDARDNGPERPVTGHDRYNRQMQVWTERIRAYCAEHGLKFEDGIGGGSEAFRIDGEYMAVGRIAAKYLPDLITESWAATAAAEPAASLAS